MNAAYDGVDRRNCADCISHSKHESEIKTLRANQERRMGVHAEMVRELNSKVNYGNFKWAFGIIVTLIVVVSGINFTTSRMSTTASTEAVAKVIESNHQVEKGLVAVESQLKALSAKLNDNVIANRMEHEFFRSAILAFMRGMDGNRALIDPMDTLNNRSNKAGE